MHNISIEQLGVYASKSIARSIDGSRDVINLSIGEPEFGPPPAISKVLSGMCSQQELTADLKRYQCSLGSSSLREAIAAYYQIQFGQMVKAQSEILVTHGGAGALTAAILATTNPGDEILIGDPSYMLYARLAVVLGRVPVYIPRQKAEGFRWNMDRMAEAITSRTAAFILNSPENPTGLVISDHELAGLVDICRRHDIHLIHDEVYDQFSFIGRHRSAGSLSGLDHVILVNSMSKKFGVPGLRVGWLVGDTRLLAIAAKAQDYTTLAVNAFSERIAERILRLDDLNEWFALVRETLRQRSELLIKQLSSIDGIAFPGPIEGGMFAFPSVSGLAERLGLSVSTGRAGDAVADWLLEYAAVAVVPGSVYGRSSGDCVRLVTCGPEASLLRGVEQIRRGVWRQTAV